MSISDFGERWRQDLQPASFRGAGFKVETGSRSGGRRLVPFEYPKQDVGFVEDLGRRLKRYRVQGYIVQNQVDMKDYQSARDMLGAALEADGSALLVHPTMGQATVYVEHYNIVEHKMKGGFCEFEMDFIEAGTQTPATPNPVASVAAVAKSTLTTLQTTKTLEAGQIASKTVA
jgi:prophage DNA circulation protein